MNRIWLVLGGTVSCVALGCSSEPSQPGATASGASPGVAGAAGAASGRAGAGGAPSPGGAAAVAGAASVSGATNGGSATGGSGGTLPEAGAGGTSPPGVGAGGTRGASGASGAGSASPTLPKRVLLYHFSTLVIPSVPAQLTFFKNKLSQWQYESDDSIDPTQIADQNLERYAAVAMINTCFEPFGIGKPDRPQSEVLQRFLRRGGGLFGTHCASVTFHSSMSPVLYNQVIGGRGGNGYFNGTSTCRTLATHPSTLGLSAQFSFVGNLDNTDYLAPDTVVLVKCTWQEANGKDVNVSWYRNEGPGRVFYTDFAKVDTDLTDATIGPHIMAGLSWVLGIP